jgi:hypothetical protein
MIAHGRRLESPLAVLPNQEITVGNPQTGEGVECRVIRFGADFSGIAYISFEFDEPSSKFWPISFPPEDWADVYCEVGTFLFRRQRSQFERMDLVTGVLDTSSTLGWISECLASAIGPTRSAL